MKNRCRYSPFLSLLHPVFLAGVFLCLVIFVTLSGQSSARGAHAVDAGIELSEAHRAALAPAFLPVHGPEGQLAVTLLETELVAKITADDAAPGDRLGAAALDDNIAVAGARDDDDNGVSAGSAYIFYRNLGGVDNWGQAAKLHASDAAADDWFGDAVGISGEVVVIGAPENSDAGTASGAVYIFYRNQGGADNWGEVAKLTASDAASGDRFGAAVSVFGDTLIVGAWGEDTGGSEAGAAYVFQRNQGGADNWGEVTKLTAIDGEADDRFGESVSISGEIAAIGAPDGGSPGGTEGAAYIFRRDQGGLDNWGEVTKRTASDAQAGDLFGSTVSLDENTLVVGAEGEDSQGGEAGAAYIFQRHEGGADNWGQVTKITAFDGASGDSFSASVAISGDTVLIGAPGDDDQGSGAGAAYRFSRNQGGPDNWGEEGKLPVTSLEAGDTFGSFVAIDINTLLVGSPGDDDGGSGAGALYAFQQRGNTWDETQKLLSSTPVDFDRFGASLDLSADTLVVGAPRDDEAGIDAGAAFIYTRNQGGAENWGEVLKLTADDGAADDRFGFSVAISGDFLVIGAPFASPLGNNSGAAYVFHRNQGGAENWGQVIKLLPSDGMEGDQFGKAVAISGETIVVGAPTNDNVVLNVGSAYIFQRNLGGENNWGEVKQITAAGMTEDDWFGHSVAIAGDTILVGVPNDDDLGQDAGALYVYARDQGGIESWGEVTKKTAADGAANDRFGWSVGIDGDNAVAGAVYDDGVGTDSGSAYVFKRNQDGADIWGQVAHLQVNHPRSFSELGWDVDIAGEIVFAGAPDDTNGLNRSGSVYIFSQNTGGADNWGLLNWLTTLNANDFDRYGAAVAVDANTLAAGMYTDDTQGENTGSAFIYEWTSQAGALYISKNSSPTGVITLGQMIEYNISYVNYWPEVVTGVVISDVVPYPIVNPTFFSSGANITPILGETFAWQVEDLDPGEGGVITIQGELDSDLIVELTFTNTVYITGTVLSITPTWAASSVSITVDLPLTANTGGPYDIDEGSTAILDASLSADQGFPIVSYEWDLDGDGQFDDAVGITTTFTSTLDDAIHFIGLRITDSLNAQDTTTSTVTVQNVAPLVAAGPDLELNPGDPVSLPPATFTDPGLADTHTALIDWGDGTIEPGLVDPVAFTVSGAHSYAGPGFYTVTVTVTDDDGGSGSDSFLVDLGGILYLPIIYK